MRPFVSNKQTALHLNAECVRHKLLRMCGAKKSIFHMAFSGAAKSIFRVGKAGAEKGVANLHNL